MKTPSAVFGRSSGWIFPALLIGSVGLHLGVFLWREYPLWVVAGEPAPPPPAIEMVLIEEFPPEPEPEPEAVEMPEEIPPVPEEPPPPEPEVIPEPEPRPAPTETALPEPTPPPPPQPVVRPPKPKVAPTRPVTSPPPRARPQMIEARPNQRHTPPPRYPESARRAGLEGRVLVRAQVDATGRVQGVSLRRSSGVPALDQAALDAVRRWRFHPRTVDGVTSAATVEVPVNFSLTH